MPLHRTKTKTKAFGALALASTLLLAGCGSSGGEINPNELSGLNVVSDEETFSVELEGTVESEEVATKVIETGSGEDIELGDLILVSTVVVDSQTGDSLGGETPISQVMDVSESQLEQFPELLDIIQNNNIGSMVGFYVPASVMGSDSGQIMVMRFDEIVETTIEGEPQELPEEFPVITDGEDNVPQMENSDADAPDSTLSAVRKSGNGETVDEDDVVLVNYIGYKWSDGEMFDSSYDREAPSAFGLNQVVAGWKLGLAGKNVGDQVVLVIPPKDGYGSSEGHELEEETLVFVVDILYAEPAE